MAATKKGISKKTLLRLIKYEFMNMCTKFEPNCLRIELRTKYFHFSSKNHKNVHQSHNFQSILLIFDWDDGLGPQNTPVTFGAIILNGLTVIAFTRQVSAADADRSEIHSSPATLRGGYNYLSTLKSTDEHQTTASLHNNVRDV